MRSAMYHELLVHAAGRSDARRLEPGGAGGAGVLGVSGVPQDVDSSSDLRVIKI